MTNNPYEAYTKWIMPDRKGLASKFHPLVTRLEGVCKGTKVHIVPLSTAYGDEVTAMGMSLTGFGESIVMLSEPFVAHFEDFDGETLLLRSDFCYRLKLSIYDVKNLIISTSDQL